MRSRLTAATVLAVLAVSAMSISPAFSAGVTKKTFAVKATGASVTGAMGITTKAAATGTITVYSSGKVCYSLNTTGLTGITEAHIHVGAVGVDGANVVTLPIAGFDSMAMTAPCTTTTPAVAKAILAKPAGYYLNVHTKAFANGAVRGQL